MISQYKHILMLFLFLFHNVVRHKIVLNSISSLSFYFLLHLTVKHFLTIKLGIINYPTPLIRSSIKRNTETRKRVQNRSESIILKR